MQLNIEQIKQIIPHRYPFLLIDKVTDFEAGSWAEAIKCVSANEPFFQGHFPQYSVMPGVLIIEALAQTGAIAILSEEENKGKNALFARIKDAKFKKQVNPGDVLYLRCDLKKKMGSFGTGEAIAKINDEIACTAEFTFAIIDA